MAQIDLTQGLNTLIDDADEQLVNKHKWFALQTGNKVYAATNVINDKGQQRTMYLHRYLLEAESGVFVIHRDSDGLNNQRENLMFSNSRRGKRGTNYLGVGETASRKKPWCAHIKHNGKVVHLGSYATAEEAARARDRNAKEVWGEYALLNFPDEKGNN